MSDPQLCVIALGGNLGDTAETFRRAAESLNAAGFRVRRTSSILRTVPVDCPPGTPDFSNAVLAGEWDDTPESLLAVCRRIEAGLGRPNLHGFHESRTLDLDLILFGDRIIRTPSLQIPHPRAAQRDFVRIPLRELDPDLEQLLLNLTRKASL